MLYWGVSARGASLGSAGASETRKLRPPVIGIVGPTAIGKTAVGLELAEKLGGEAEILSADSMQVYRRMDIGAAKPTEEEKARATFHAIDLVDPDEDFTLADFQAVAEVSFDEIARRGRVALLVGGTGLYVRAITTNLEIPQSPPEPALRERWRQFAIQHGQEALHMELARIDPQSAARIHVNDTKRIIRALEVYEKTGQPLSTWHAENRRRSEGDNRRQVLFALNCNRATLYEAIEQRVDRMILDGFVDEVKGLRSEGYSPSLKPMQALGYKQVNSYLDGEITLETAIDAVKKETRHFARRQLIWFRADKRLNWISTDGLTPNAIAEQIRCAVDALNGSFLTT